MSIIFNSADIAETMNNGVSNVTGADSTITENYTNVVQHGIKIDMSVSEHTISGTPPLTFNSNGTPLIDYTIYGNTIQDGTPTSNNPVAVNGVGALSNGVYTIPIRTNTITNINLNSIQTTRRIKKLILTGEERGTWSKNPTITAGNAFYNEQTTTFPNYSPNKSGYCTHFATATSSTVREGVYWGAKINFITDINDNIDTAAKWKQYLAQQYANGTPVTIWYVLATPETSTVNEPLMKIGNYADSVSYSQAGVTIPTVSGNNTLDVQTTPKPSNISITYKGR